MSCDRAGRCPVRGAGTPGAAAPNARYPGVFTPFYDLAQTGGGEAGRETMQAITGLLRGEYRPVVGGDRDGTWRPEPPTAVVETAVGGAGGPRRTARPVP